MKTQKNLRLLKTARQRTILVKDYLYDNYADPSRIGTASDERIWALNPSEVENGGLYLIVN